MEQEVIKSPGRITIELVRPKKQHPLRGLLRIWGIYFIVVGGLKLLSLLFG